MKKRKLQCGPMITSLDHLARCNWVIIHGKPYNRGWVVSWQFRMAKAYVDNGCAYEEIRLTNAQYYPNLTKEKVEARFADELRKYSPCRTGGNCPIAAECEDDYCWKSYAAWREAPVT